MRLVFAGTPEFAARALEAIVAAGHEIVLVLAQPDRPAGRGLALTACPVKRRAEALGIEVFQPPSLKDLAAVDRIRAAGADAMVVAAYGMLLPPDALSATTRGAINIHASLLPRWRGAAPIQRALMAGDARTGITVMQMDEGLDTGPMLLQRAIEIRPEDDAGTLHDRLAALGSEMIVEALALPGPVATPQPSEGVTYAKKLAREDARLDWNRDAAELERIVRAMRPSPGAQCELSGETVKVWRCEVDDSEGVPGTLLRADDRGIVVACGNSALRLLEVQRPGGKRLHVADFLRGARVSARRPT